MSDLMLLGYSLKPWLRWYILCYVYFTTIQKLEKSTVTEIKYSLEGVSVFAHEQQRVSFISSPKRGKAKEQRATSRAPETGGHC